MLADYKLALKEAANNANDVKEHPEYKAARLYAVSMQTPMLEAKDVEARLIQKYGEVTKKVTEDNGVGVYLWELTGGYIYQWVELVEGNLYTRRVDYLSQKVGKELTDDFPLFFTAREKHILLKTKL